MADKKTQLMAQFYITCQKQGYTDMNDATQSLKAKVIATDMKLNYGNIVVFYDKAKQCYQEILAEKAEAKKEAERRSVDGMLLITLCEYKSELKVYVRPDKTIYTVYDNGEKEEGAPTFSVSKGGTLDYTYRPSKAIYTSATVGGITTGGVHYTKEGYDANIKKSKSGIVTVKTKSHELTLRIAQISDAMKEAFKRDPEYLEFAGRGGRIVCSTVSSSDITSAVLGGGSFYGTQSSLSHTLDANRKPYEFCVGAVNLIERIIRGQLPPSDEVLYKRADSLAQSNSAESILIAAERFEVIADYKDAAKRAKALREKYEVVLQTEKEAAVLKKESSRKRNKRIVVVFSTMAAVVLVAMLLVTQLIIPINKYKAAEELLADGDVFHAAVAYYEANGYKDSYERSMDLWNEIAQRETITTGDNHTVGLKSDGAVVASGNPDYAWDDVSSWTDIVAISAGSDHTVGLKADGTVVVDSLSSSDSTSKVDDWADIVAISAGHNHTVGLKADGTVVATEYTKYNLGQSDVEGWTDIVAISAGDYHTIGLKADGTVVATEYAEDANHGFPYLGECDVEDWTDIIAISTSEVHTVGLKSDGTVVAVGLNNSGQCDVSSWTDIVAISAGNGHTVGLKADGTVVATEYTGEEHYYCGECDVDGWTDIIAISAGDNYTVGMKADGTIVAVGDNFFGQLDAAYWTSMKIPN